MFLSIEITNQNYRNKTAEDPFHFRNGNEIIYKSLFAKKME
jgi:hypothetical protein